MGGWTRCYGRDFEGAGSVVAGVSWPGKMVLGEIDGVIWDDRVMEEIL